MKPMITNKTRAKLIGCSRYWGARFDGPFFDTDANAVAELRAFVRARGNVTEFCGHVLKIVAPTLNIGAFPTERILDLLDATPAQQCAAFDAVFKDDLERINET